MRATQLVKLLRQAVREYGDWEVQNGELDYCLVNSVAVEPRSIFSDGKSDLIVLRGTDSKTPFRTLIYHGPEDE